ncbi:polysaccharide biosynthesis tyrosine autokinase [uncultured Bifidobacterium sp.]|uniref:polysaccharide biosynthesis tyrosine autokinase n=1 Tax=uncultured Bifidobacterium sp. TaxID=165187 RepID=UPI0028DC20DF|nr:polysaccharide biosynthesis tyrosine autokinase [uncultured Bifidobacterium sp.]
MTIADLWHILRKHLTTVILVFVAVFAAVAVVTFVMPPKYTATAELFATYTSSSDSQDTSSDMNSGASYLSTQIKTYPSLVKTESILKPVIKDLGLDMTVDDLADAVTATNPTNTFMVDISVENGDAGQSAAIANSVAENLAKQISSSLYSSSTSGSSPIELSVVQKAQTPTSPSSPKIPLYLAVGFVLALILAVAAALLKDVLNTKVDGSEDAKELTDTSSLGSVPRSDAFNDEAPAIVSRPNSMEAEEFRRIRSNISFLSPTATEKGHLLVITSTEPSEGKTTISANIAASIAEEGKTVLLIDSDLRHPSVAHRLKIEGHVGLSHILSGQATPRDVVQPYWKPNLHILPAGKRPANASILLNSDIMRELIEQALKQYDYVIIDTAPMTVANEATVFGRIADGVVMVVGRGVADKKDLKATVESLKTAEVPVFGFILNFANPKKIHSNNYYYYYSDNPRKNGRQPKGKHL